MSHQSNWSFVAMAEQQTLRTVNTHTYTYCVIVSSLADVGGKRMARPGQPDKQPDTYM